MANKCLFTLNNPKTLKGEALDYLTYILHLAPHKLSGRNVCPMASKQCIALCLNTAGHGGMFRAGETTNVVQEARIRRTKWMFDDREGFMTQLAGDILRAIAYAEKQGKTAVFRLNGTSDIRWETIPVNVTATVRRKKIRVQGDNLMLAFPNVQFYDYSKLENRKNIPANYHLTYSRSETNETAMLAMLKQGENVAVVFSTKKGKPLPKKWKGYKVVDGDLHDLRFLDPNGVVIGLRAKGRARKDTLNGFVVQV